MLMFSVFFSLVVLCCWNFNGNVKALWRPLLIKFLYEMEDSFNEPSGRHAIFSTARQTFYNCSWRLVVVVDCLCITLMNDCDYEFDWPTLSSGCIQFMLVKTNKLIYSFILKDKSYYVTTLLLISTNDDRILTEGLIVNLMF